MWSSFLCLCLSYKLIPCFLYTYLFFWLLRCVKSNKQFSRKMTKVQQVSTNKVPQSYTGSPQIINTTLIANKEARLL